MSIRSRRDESGAIAVMVALLSMVLLISAAMTVDLGQTFVAKHEVQRSADLSALASGANGDLPTPATSASCSGGAGYLNGPRALSGSKAVTDAANYLSRAPGYFTSKDPTGNSIDVQAAELTDCLIANGEVVFGLAVQKDDGSWSETYNPYTVTVVTPRRTVRYGFAGATGVTSGSTQAQATVRAGTPGGSAVMPAYATSGCDWGSQTIIDPANGVAGYTPALANPADSNIVNLDASTSPNPSPTTVPVNPSSTTVTVSGNNKMVQATQVGFFKDGDTTGPAYVIPQTSLLNVNAGKGMSFTLPNPAVAGLTTTDGTWYIRVWAPTANNGTTYQWSAASEAVPFVVGDSMMRCSGASSAGNFGALKLPRTDSTNATGTGWMPRNIIAGLQAPLSLHTFPGAPTTYSEASTAPSLCTTLPTGSVYSTTTGSPVLRAQTNCLDTDTGLPANSITAGLVGGVAGVTSPQDVAGNACAPNCGSLVVNPSNSSQNQCGRSARPITLGSRTYNINDDVLTCYLTSAVALSTIESPTYAGGAVLSCKIYNSPRFFYQPVLQSQPTDGASAKYSIIDFRPAFLTAQAQTATMGAGPTSADNGVTARNNSINQLDVIFFNNNALNQTCSNAKVSDSLGGTTKPTPRLIN